MGLTLQADEDLYLMRMCITVDKQTSIASFNEPDLRRLEQVLIDALGEHSSVIWTNTGVYRNGHHV